MSFLSLPNLETKPRSRGLSCAIDNGVPFTFFRDVIESHGDFIDKVKFGWGTALVTSSIANKIEVLKSNNIEFFFGGTLLEKAVLQGKVDEFQSYCDTMGAGIVEVSDGTIELEDGLKAQLISKFCKNFEVYSEVGYKDQSKSQDLAPKKWVQFIKSDLEAGASKVITESRESGTSGICRPSGEVRYGLIEEILDSEIDSNDLVFEAPNKSLQVYFIKKLGPQVNLGNIAMTDIVALETLRLGLRSDTFFDFEERQPEA